MPVVAVAVAAWQVAAAVEVGFAALTAFQTLAVVGSVTSAVGAVTGNKDLSKAGMIMGAVGGVGSFAQSQGWMGAAAQDASAPFNNALMGKETIGIKPEGYEPLSSDILQKANPEGVYGTGITPASVEVITPIENAVPPPVENANAVPPPVVDSAVAATQVAADTAVKTVDALSVADKQAAIEQFKATSFTDAGGKITAVTDGVPTATFNSTTSQWEKIATSPSGILNSSVSTDITPSIIRNPADAFKMSYMPGQGPAPDTGYWDSFKAFSKANPTIAYAGLTTIGTTMAGLFDQTKAAQKQNLEAQAALTAQQVANINRPIGTATPGAPRGPVSLLNSPVTGRVA